MSENQTPKHVKRSSNRFTLVTPEDIGRCTPRMLGPWLYLRIRTGGGVAPIITVEEITAVLGWPTNTVVRGIQDLIEAGMVKVLPAPGRLRRLYAVDPESAGEPETHQAPVSPLAGADVFRDLYEDLDYQGGDL